MRYIFSISLLLILCAPAGLYSAGVTLLLYPSYTASGSDLRVNNIARINADSATAEALGSIIISSEFYSDGFIDRQELMSMLSDNGFADCVIYGNAVRISEPLAYKEASVPGLPLISRGAPVTYIMKNRGIILTVKGVAQEPGFPGDLIKVRVNKGRVVSGRIIDKETVESES